MNKSEVKKLELPDAPGVYFFLGAQKEILYIGKATSLRSRVLSYFASDIKEKRSELIENMVKLAVTVTVTETDSVLEALILETNLIRSHKPKYNTKSKDDKSYNHLIITNEDWPRVLVVRGKDITESFLSSDIKYEFGPFPSGALFREALKIIRRLFKFYDTKKPIGEEKTKFSRGKIDFNKQIGLYPTTENREEYLKTIRHIKLFFQGKKGQIIKELKRDMNAAAKAEAFEEAGAIKRRIFALEHIRDISLIKRDFNQSDTEKQLRIEAFDVAHLFGEEMVGVMTVVKGITPAKSEYRKFKIRSVDKSNDTAALKEMLERRFAHTEWDYPDLLVVDGAIAQKNAAQSILETFGLTIPIIAVVKDKQHKPVRLLGNNQLITEHKESVLLANAESHRFAVTFHRKRRDKKFLP